MRSRLRLLVTTSDLVGRGAERELVNLLSFLPRDRYDLHLCLWRDVFDYPVPADIPITILNKRRPWHVFRTVRRMASLIDSWRPDLVYSQLNYVSTVTGSALGLCRQKTRWLCRLAGNPEVEIRFPILPWTRRALRRANVIAGCSRGAAGAIERHLRVPSERIRVLRNVVDIDAIRPLAEEPSPIRKMTGRFTFITAGRLTPQKNHALLIDAFARLNQPASELWILGEGPLGSALRRKVAELGVADKVRWLGFCKNPFAALREADAFVLSSDYEGLPNVVIEAMLVGLPVVSTDCPYGPGELIEHGRTGLLVPVGDTRSLTEAMGGLLESREGAQAMGAAGRDWALESFRPDRIVEEYLSVFEEAASGSRQEVGR